jgi:hypothetical protein
VEYAADLAAEFVKLRVSKEGVMKCDVFADEKIADNADSARLGKE